MKRIWLLLTVISSTICYSQSVTTISLGATEDTYTFSGNPTGNYYTSTSNWVYVDASGNYYRSFYKFDFSSIPLNSVIVTAQFMLMEDGTENVGLVNSNELYLDACNSSWSQTTLTHNSGIQNNQVLPTITVSNHPGWYRQFEVKDHLQAMVDNRVPNYGWRLRRNPENTTSLVTKYKSKEGTPTQHRPGMQIMYYRRAIVSAATIVHASGGSSNGSISPTIQYGSSPTRSYQWYNSSGALSGATSLNLTNRPYGWYGLKSWGTTAGDTLFQAFLIGSKCETVDISFTPSGDYVDDATVNNHVTGSGTGIYDRKQTNLSSYAINSTEQWTNGTWYERSSFLRFKLWVDPAMAVNVADLTMYGSGHYPLHRSNNSKLSRIEEDWIETGISFSNRPAINSTEFTAIPNIPTGNGNFTTDVSEYFNYWKTNNLANYGWDLSLSTYIIPAVSGSTYTRMSFESSDGVNKPTIAFKVTLLDNTCDFTSYTRFKDVLDGSFVRTIQGKLKIQLNEDYDQKAGRFVKMTLYDAANNQVKAGINHDGSIVGPALLPAKLLEFDYNQHVLDLTGYSLVVGNTYVLELTNSKNEKSYIKFKYYN